MNKFTEKQIESIKYEGSNILISAGAGSGKTTVLTERVVDKLKKGISLNEILVLTFTNAAAQEMKERIKNKIFQEESLHSQLELVETANIMTFDAYILLLVKKYGYKLKIDKNISIGDFTLLDRLLDEVIEEEIEEIVNSLTKNLIHNNKDYLKYSEIINDSQTSIQLIEENLSNPQKLDLINELDLIENYMGFDNENLKKILKNLYNGYTQILNKEKLFKTSNSETINEFFKEYEKIVLNEIKKLNNEIQNLNKLPIDEVGKEYVEKTIQKVQIILQAKSYDEVIIGIENIQTVSKTRSKKMGNAELINSEIEIIQNQIKIIKTIIIMDDKKNLLKQEIEKSYLKEYLFKKLENIEQKNYQKKLENKIFSFQDIMCITIKLLEDDAIKNEIKNQYSEIMVDEYQDTNDFQNYFIQLIANNNLYLVGDVKQSIYRFRNANPQNFNQLQNEYQEIEKPGKVIKLIDNFRSRSEVLESVNIIFEKLMTPQTGGINYLDDHALNYKNKNYEMKSTEQNYLMELLNYSEDKIIEDLENLKISKTQIKNYLEPLVIGYDILNKLNNNYQVLENNQLRKCKESDFVILTRNKNQYLKYQEVFEYLQIKLLAQQEEYLNDANNDEIIVIKNILKAIVEPRNKTARISIFRSFICEVPEQEIYNFKIHDQSSETIQIIEAKIEKLKNSKNGNLAYLLNKIYDEFEIVEKLSKLSHVNVIFSRLNKIEDICQEFSRNGKNILELIDYLEYLLNNTEQKLEIDLEKEKHNSVKLMTIHKSKGLEFPIVYIAGTNVDINRSNTNKIKISSEYGISYKRNKDFFEEENFIDKLINLKEEEENLFEAIRLLYVAMTRAKEKIIIVNDEDSLNKSNIQNIKDSKKFSQLIHYLKTELKETQKDNLLKKEDIENFWNYKDTQKIPVQIVENSNNISLFQYRSNKVEKIEKFLGQASINQKELINSEVKENINLGIQLHNLLENIDFKNLSQSKSSLEKATSNAKEIVLLKEILTRMKKDELFTNVLSYWTEYQFQIEDETVTNGIIDLIIEKEEEILIIDYKLQDIEKEEYVNQLNTYKKFIETKTNKKIRCILYALLEDKLKEI